MGFLQDWGLAPSKKPLSSGKFNLNEKHSVTELKKAARSLNIHDRRKFLNILKEESRWGTPSSNRQLVNTLRRRGEPLAFRQRIKSQLLTHNEPVQMSEAERQRHVRLTIADRLREASKKSSAAVSKARVLASDPSSKAQTSAVRPGITREEKNLPQTAPRRGSSQRPF